MDERAESKGQRLVTWPRGWGAPRLLTRAQVRAYLQENDSELTAQMEHGQLPGPLWGCDPELPSARWDRRAIDRALDQASGVLQGSMEAAEEELNRALGTTRRRA